MKAEIGQKLGLLPQALSQAVNAKKKFQKEIKNAAAVNAEMVRERNSLIADTEKVLVAPIEKQTSYSIPLTQYSLMQRKALTLQFCGG